MCRNASPAYRLAQHGISADDYGSLYGLSLGSAAAATACKPCPRLAGIVQISAPASSRAAGFSGPVVLAGGGVSLTWRMHDGGATFAVGVHLPAGVHSLWALIYAVSDLKHVVRLCCFRVGIQQGARQPLGPLTCCL